MKKRKVNYYKVLALLLLIIEIGIAIWVDQGVVKESLLVWRLYVLCIMCIPINIMFIFAKRKAK